MLAAERGHIEATGLLLECGASVGFDVEGHSAGTLAVRGGYAAVVQRLLQSRAMEVDSAIRAGFPTMLHHAAHHGQGGCASLLCELDADVNALLVPSHLTPLMLASARGHVDIVRELLAYAACVNDVDSEGQTAWVHAMGVGNSGVCVLLASSGAVERAAGEAPLQVAAKAMGTGEAQRWQDWKGPGAFGTAGTSRALEGALPDPSAASSGAQPRPRHLSANTSYAAVARAPVGAAAMRSGGVPTATSVPATYALMGGIRAGL